MERPIYDYSARLAQRTQELAHQASEQIPEGARNQFNYWSGRLRSTIIQRPGLSLGVALGMGVFLGWLIKRR